MVILTQSEAEFFNGLLDATIKLTAEQKWEALKNSKKERALELQQLQRDLEDLFEEMTLKIKEGENNA